MLLEMKDVRKQYGGFELACSMQLQHGCVTGLIGRNGAGKSTAFKSILGLITPDSGEISVLGKAPEALTAKEREDIGVAFVDSGFSNFLRIKDIIPIMRAEYAAFDAADFRRKCERFELPMNKNLKGFSTGMKAKLRLLLAMSHKARLLILDEPTAGLDVLVREELLDLLRAYMEDEECGILISSHISSDLENFCDDVYMIEEGKIVLHEDTDILLGEYGVMKLTGEQYEGLDKEYILRRRTESYGYCCLTNRKRFYVENYPELAMEKGSIDNVIAMMVKGEAV
ncbi:MAG: ABC transporter ATP-binding protein [Roseburia sp.]|nr:ABC transporter ATP-binding protein [Roseburia sp.]